MMSSSAWPRRSAASRAADVDAYFGLRLGAGTNKFGEIVARRSSRLSTRLASSGMVALVCAMGCYRWRMSAASSSW